MFIAIPKVCIDELNGGYVEVVTVWATSMVMAKAKSTLKRQLIQRGFKLEDMKIYELKD